MILATYVILRIWPIECAGIDFIILSIFKILKIVSQTYNIHLSQSTPKVVVFTRYRYR